ncbi:hypothetical protein [Mucilaginibacter rubeus]|uniref:Uncharacterized protein n=1 Tax=Mucilaginibacter rubeus TaxID=2027860 RepID=A0A5C1HTB8_9SPHI|nr:hypothetical protein [Mucilaginibacter rubeus]QEM09076.1 hypothetical protein DEO27_003265 [Mucilaginibacter rubeus]
MDRKLIGRLEQLNLSAGRKVRICSIPGCRERTVKNHCVSQALIGSFSEDGHLRTLIVNLWITGGLMFRQTGVRDVSTFHGLCNGHDHTIFSPVDSATMDTKNYHNQLLLSYRSLLNEKLKKTNKREAYCMFYQEHKGSTKTGVQLAKRHSAQFEYNLLSVASYEQQLLDEIAYPKGCFIFNVLEFPYFGVAGSELFSYEPDEITHLKRANHFRFNVLDPFADIFVHIVPSKEKNKLDVVVGAHEKDELALKYFYDHLKNTEPLKSLSDLLFLFVGDWVCSETFFRDYLQGYEHELVKIFSYTSTVSATSIATFYNLFTAHEK